MKAFKHVRSHYHLPNPLTTKIVNLNPISYQSFSTESHPNPQSSEWRDQSLPKLIKLTPLLNHLDLINGRLVNVHNNRTVHDDFLLQNMHTFKCLATSFLQYQLHQTLSTTGTQYPCINKPNYKEPISLNSLKKICDILDISPQKRKLVRLSICPQVTQHQIWIGAIQEILNQLKHEMDVKDDESIIMGQQIVVNCLEFLDDVISYDPDSSSWMRITPKNKKDSNFPPSAKWEDFLEMVSDLIICLKNNEEFLLNVTKLEIMKEGLYQIKDVIVDKNIGYKDLRHQQSLVQKKLTKSLGHSSKCLFTLLLFYLYGSVGDIEVDVCCWFSDVGGDKFCLCVGKVLTGEERLRGEVEKLDTAIRVIKFVYEMAEMKESLEVQGHLWCFGCESRSLVYRRHTFFIHGISL